MNCPSCGAPLRLDSGTVSLSCDYCRSVYFPEKNAEGVRVLGEEAAESCPVCRIPLLHAVLARERIRYCTTCRGMLIRMGAFTVLIDELRSQRGGASVQPAPDRRDLDRKIDCPECHHRMDTHFYGGPGNVVIDDCSRCSLNWLDHDELMRIVAAPDRSYGEEYDAAGGD
jgi:Zn-finger nucleic acid-binding protein